MGTNGKHVTHLATPVDAETAALADRIAELMRAHSMPTAIAIAIREGAASASGPLYVGWREAGISRRVWQRLVSTGELPAVKIGRAHMATPADVAKCMQRQKVRPIRAVEQRSNTVAAPNGANDAAARVARLARAGALEAHS